MAAKFGVPVCPHAGGVGLCEYVQHLAVFDYLSVSGSLDGRVVEWVDHLHEHFVHPALVVDGRYVLPGGARLQHRDAPVVARGVRVSRTAGSGRARRGAGRLGMGEMAESIEPRARAGRPGRPHLPAAAGGAARAARRPGADPLPPGRRRQPDDAGLLHEPEHRQRPLADGGDRRPRARPAARDRQPRHRPLGRLDRRALGRRRRDRLHARALDGARHPRDPRDGSRGRPRQRHRLRGRSHPASVHRHARDAQHRARARAVGGERHAHLGHAGGGRHARRRLDRLAPVLDVRRRRAGAARARRDDVPRLGTLALRRRRQPGRRAAQGSRSAAC